MHIVPKLTPAEVALVDTYEARLSDLPGDAGTLMARDRAVEAIKGGLPTRRVESWHYTDLRRLMAEVPGPGAPVAPRALPPIVADSVVLPFLAGTVGKLPTVDGAKLRRLNTELRDGALATLLELRGNDDAVGAINTALVADGVGIEIPAESAVAAPIELQNLHAGGQTHVLYTANAGVGAKAVIVERHSGEGAALVSAVSHLTVADGADVTWIIVQDHTDTATHLGQLNATIGKDARLTVFVMNTGARLVRQELRIRAAGEGCQFTLRGVNLLAGATHCDVTMVLDHVAYGATSTEVVRNVVLDKAHGVFQGQIRVAREAQKTDAKMACNTLLLSDDADFSVKPELEIFADDVACGHGATVAEIDRSHLFYLMARGVTEKEARGLLVKAFLAEVIEELGDERIVEPLEARLDAWFATHG